MQCIDGRARSAKVRLMTPVLRKFIKWSAIAVAIMAAVVVCLAIALALWPDTKAPDDAAMLPVPKPNSGKGPLADWEDWLGKHGASLRIARLDMGEFDNPWQADRAQSLLDKHGEILEKYAAFAETPSSSWSWKQAPTFVLSGPMGEITLISDVLKLEVIHIRQKIETGDYAGAAIAAERLVKTGQGLRKSGGLLIHHLVGNFHIRRGLECFEELASKNAGNGDDWKRWQEIVTQAEPELGDLVDAIEVEYLACKKFALAFAGDDQLNLNYSQHVAYRKGRLFFKPNAFMKLYLRFEEPVHVSLRDGKWSAINKAIKLSWDDYTGMREHQWLHLVSSNAVGNMLIHLALPTSTAVANAEFIIKARIRAAACVIAVHRFTIEKGQPPETLADLVPEYLQAVPADPFNEQPMKWNKASGTVYSVGPDLKDGGGAVNEKPSRLGDAGTTDWWAK